MANKEPWYLDITVAQADEKRQREQNNKLGIRPNYRNVIKKVNRDFNEGVQDMQTVPQQEERTKAGVYSMLNGVNTWNSLKSVKADEAQAEDKSPRLDVSQLVAQADGENEVDRFRFQVHVITDGLGGRTDEMVYECRYLKTARRRAEDMYAGDFSSRLWYVLDTKTKERWAVR